MEAPEPQSDPLNVGQSAVLGYPVSEGSLSHQPGGEEPHFTPAARCLRACALFA